MQARCQCGMVAFITPTSRPLTVYHCHCLECRKQSASAYGTSAIFPAEPLFPLSQDLRNKLAVYTRSTDSGNTLDCYFCKACGVRVFHRSRNAEGVELTEISVKGGVIEGLDFSRAGHIWVSRAVVPIPSNVEQWDEEPDC